MEIINHKDGIKLITRYLIEKKIIPIFGSGLTVGCKADRGSVPDSKQACLQMLTLIKAANQQIDEEQLLRHGFNKIALHFIKKVEEDIKAKYFKNNYTNVQIIDAKKGILALPWTSIFTLNIDDGIENTAKLETVLPYRRHRTLNSSIKLLYKLHGDAREEFKYKSESIVFSEPQYWDALTNESNKDMLNTIEAAYTHKNILFYGCSLNHEPDLINIYNRVSKMPSASDRIYVTDFEPDDTKKIDLELYGINKILLVENYNQFCLDLVAEFRNDSDLKNITGYEYVSPTVKVISSKAAVFSAYSRSRIFDESNNSFSLTSLHVIRDVLREIDDKIRKFTCVAIKGRRFSGKSSLLASSVIAFNKYKILFFSSTSNVDEDVVMNLFINETNTLFIFDSNATSRFTYNCIINSLETIKKSGSKVLIAINSNDSQLLLNKDTDLVEMSNTLNDDGELEAFNRQADMLALAKRAINETNLDYMKRINREQGDIFHIPLRIPKEFSKNEYILMILLCACDKIFTSDLISLKITNEEKWNFLKKLTGVIEEIRTERNEATTYSSTKIVHNSKIVLTEILERLSIDELIDCICMIAKTLKGDRIRYRRYAVEVVLFDTLNQLFGGSQGAGKLIFDIYEKLEVILFDDMHYWLQRAKSIYRLTSDSRKNLLEAYKYAKKVYNDSNRKLKAKAALSSGIICSLLYKIASNEDEKESFRNETVDLIFYAMESEFYVKDDFLKTDFYGKRKKTSSYDLIHNICISEKNNLDRSRQRKSDKIISELTRDSKK